MMTIVATIVIIALYLLFFNITKDKETFYIPSSLEEIEKKIDKKEHINVYVYQNNCSTCIYFSETIKRNQIYSDVFGINLDEETSTRFLEEYDIMSTPTIIRFADGSVFMQSNDVKKEKQLIDFFNK